MQRHETLYDRLQRKTWVVSEKETTRQPGGFPCYKGQSGVALFGDAPSYAKCQHTCVSKGYPTAEEGGHFLCP